MSPIGSRSSLPRRYTLLKMRRCPVNARAVRGMTGGAPPADEGGPGMNRILAYGILAICVVGVPGAAGQQPTFRGTGDSVRVFVTVTDRDGRLVTTLSQTDFEVRDEGQPQPITL